MPDILKQQALKLLKAGLLSKEEATKALSAVRKLQEAGKKLSLLLYVEKKGLLEGEQLLKARELLKGKKAKAEENSLTKKTPSEEKTSKEKIRKKVPVEISAKKEAKTFSKKSEDKDSKDAGKQEKDKTPASVARTLACPECHSDVAQGSKECHTCGASIAKSAKLKCRACSALLAGGSEVCPRCGSDPFTGSAGPKTPRCKQCHKPVLPEDAVCLSCGADLDEVLLSGGAGEHFSRILLALLLVFSLAGTGFALCVSSVEKRGQEGYAGYEEAQSPFDGIESFILQEKIPLLEEEREKTQSSLELAKEGKWQELAQSCDPQSEAISIERLRLWAIAQAKEGGEDKAYTLISLYLAEPEDEILKNLALKSALERVQSWIKTGELEKARLAALQLETWTENEQASFWAGVLQFALGKTELAESSLRRAEQLRPESALLLYGLLMTRSPTLAKTFLDRFNQQSQLPEDQKEKLKSLLIQAP